MSSPSRSEPEPLAIDLDHRLPAARLLALGLVVVHAISALLIWEAGREPLLDALFLPRLPGARVFVGGQLAALIDAGQVWRLATSVLLHVDALHLLLNAVAIATLGRLIEPWVGGLRLWAWFAWGGVGGSLASHLAGVRQSDGASGGAFALLGAAIVLGWRWRHRLDAADRRLMGPILWGFLAVNLLASVLVPAIDAVGHLGGLLVGFAVAWIPARRWITRAEQLSVGAFALICAVGWITS